MNMRSLVDGKLEDQGGIGFTVQDGITTSCAVNANHTEGRFDVAVRNAITPARIYLELLQVTILHIRSLWKPTFRDRCNKWRGTSLWKTEHANFTNESALTVERPEDTDEIRELCAALVRTQGEHNAAEAANPRPARRQGPASRSIARPSNMLTGDVHCYMDAGLLDLSIGWKQDNRRLAKVYDAIEAAYPDLERFRGQWATAHLVHETFSGQRTYKNCKTREGTYRARTRRTRRSNINHSCADSPDDNVFGGVGPRAPPHSPNASPSPPTNNSPVGSRGHRASRMRSLPVLTPEPED
ncbi:hypothetical protein C8R44DRAFT_867445 [Mycena epipterygia]|nr:hypothetical protein C8R44DRAFT_867445 [Mycena epipterygia]